MPLKKKKKEEEDLKQREKRTHALIQQGLTEKAGRAQARAEMRMGLEEEKEIEVKKVAAAPVLEETGALEEVKPREVSLAPRKEFGEEVPVIGRTMAVEFGLLDTAVKKGWIPGFLLPKPTRERAKAAVPTAEEEFPLPQDPLTVREAALREIRAKSFKKGITVSESFGALVEAIPLVGGAVGRYVGGLVEAPYSNSQRVVDEINKIKEAASTGQEKVRNGLEDPDYGLDRARSMESDLAKLEGRLKLLINSSAILRANTDEVNKIQEQILEAREKVARYRRASSFGLTAQLTGTGRPIPTDEQIYYELQAVKGGK